MRTRVALILTILGLVMALTAAPVAAASLTVNSTGRHGPCRRWVLHAPRGDHRGQHRYRLGGIAG